MSSEILVSTDRPYRILFVADLAGSADGKVSGSLAEGVVDVTPTNFDELMAEAKPSIEYTTTDPATGDKAMITVSAMFESLKQFDPLEVAGRTPANALVAMRELIRGRMSGKVSAKELADGADKAAASNESLKFIVPMLSHTPTKTVSDSAVDDVLGQLDLGDGDDAAPASSGKNDVGKLLSDAAGGGLSADEASAMRRCLAEIDTRLNKWLNHVMHGAQFQSLESAWRSLKFLVSTLDFRAGVRLSVLHAHRDELAERFRTLLIDPVFDEGAAAPDLIVVDHVFDRNAPDMELMDELAQHAASIPAVAMVNVGTKFMGISFAWQLTTMPPMIQQFDQWQYAKWKSLRSAHYAGNLAVFFGRCLLRSPHGRDDVADGAFAFKEISIAEKDFLWANGSVAGACAVAASQSAISWPTRCAGYAHGRVAGLAIAMGGAKGDKQFGPTDTMLPVPKIEELAAIGLNAAVGVKDLTDAIVWNGLTAARPEKLDPNAFLEVSLPYRLFAARLSNLLLELKPHMMKQADGDVAAFVTRHITQWLTIEEAVPTADQISVAAQPVDGEAGSFGVVVSVAPPASILPATERIRVDLGIRLR